MRSSQPAFHFIASAEAEDAPYSRVTVSAEGRFMRPDQSEHDCIVDTMSPLDAVITCATLPKVGERIIAYLDYVGRIEGEVIEIGIRSFTISINASDRKRDRLSAQLAWLANKNELGVPDDRHHQRVVTSSSSFRAQAR